MMVTNQIELQSKHLLTSIVERNIPFHLGFYLSMNVSSPVCTYLWQRTSPSVLRTSLTSSIWHTSAQPRQVATRKGQIRQQKGRSYRISNPVRGIFLTMSLREAAKTQQPPRVLLTHQITRIIAACLKESPAMSRLSTLLSWEVTLGMALAHQKESNSLTLTTWRILCALTTPSVSILTPLRPSFWWDADALRIWLTSNTLWLGHSHEAWLSMGCTCPFAFNRSNNNCSVWHRIMVAQGDSTIWGLHMLIWQKVQSLCAHGKLNLSRSSSFSMKSDLLSLWFLHPKLETLTLSTLIGHLLCLVLRSGETYQGDRLIDDPWVWLILARLTLSSTGLFNFRFSN